MTSNLYLFDPKRDQPKSRDKPLIQVMREAELARAEESARILRSTFASLTSLFRSKKPEVLAGAKSTEKPVEEHRLAA